MTPDANLRLRDRRHHGKVFTGSLNTVTTTRKSLAIKVFDRQQFNIGGSGRGALETFAHDVELYAERNSVETEKKTSA